jgi:hypothetical protein
MKRLALLLVLVALPAAAADDKPWPQRGDTVYVAAALPALNMPMDFGGKRSDLSELRPCTPTEFSRMQSKRVVLIDRSGGIRWLEGEWGDRLFKSEDACRKLVPADVKVQWRSSGYIPVYLIVPAAPPQPEQ